MEFFYNILGMLINVDAIKFVIQHNRENERIELGARLLLLINSIHKVVNDGRSIRTSAAEYLELLRRFESDHPWLELMQKRNRLLDLCRIQYLNIEEIRPLVGYQAQAIYALNSELADTARSVFSLKSRRLMALRRQVENGMLPTSMGASGTATESECQISLRKSKNLQYTISWLSKYTSTPDSDKELDKLEALVRAAFDELKAHFPMADLIVAIDALEAKSHIRTHQLYYLDDE